MSNDLIREITINTIDNDERYRIGSQIHNQLAGNQDYIDSNIILNCDMYDCQVKIWIYKECKYVPPIAIY